MDSPGATKQGGWASAYVNEPRNPQGSGRASGEWTRGGAMAAQQAAWQQAVSGHHNPIPVSGAGGRTPHASPPPGPRPSDGETPGQEARERAEREQAEDDLQRAREIDREIAGLRRELSGLRTRRENANQRAVRTGAAPRAPSRPRSGQQSQPSLTSRIGGVEDRIRELEHEAAELRREAARLFAESKAVTPTVIKVGYEPRGITLTAGALAEFLAIASR